MEVLKYEVWTEVLTMHVYQGFASFDHVRLFWNAQIKQRMVCDLY